VITSLLVQKLLLALVRQLSFLLSLELSLLQALMQQVLKLVLLLVQGFGLVLQKQQRLVVRLDIS
jgi:hypothetical protein